MLQKKSLSTCLLKQIKSKRKDVIKQSRTVKQPTVLKSGLIRGLINGSNEYYSEKNPWTRKKKRNVQFAHNVHIYKAAAFYNEITFIFIVAFFPLKLVEKLFFLSFPYLPVCKTQTDEWEIMTISFFSLRCCIHSPWKPCTSEIYF